MYNSTIKRKLCKGCNDRYPKMGLNGYCSTKCMPEDMAANPKYSRSRTINRNAASLSSLSRKVKSYAKENNSLVEPVSGQNRKLAIDKWFNDRRYEMSGTCVCGCGQKSSKGENRYFKHSIAHVLGKAKFPSIATHPVNFIELAFWGGCHSTFDDKGYAYCKETNPKLWAIVVQRFKVLFPCIAENEIKYIPDVLMYELDNQ